MSKMQQRITSGILALSMILSTMPSAFAGNESNSGAAQISFAASKYIISEHEKKLKVKIIRTGGNDRKVAVAFKAADFTAEYGDDYVVLDENGDELPVGDGIAPDESMFEEVSDNAIITEVDEDTTVTDDQTTEKLEESEQNTEDNNTTDEIINDEGEVEELSTVIENVSDAEIQEETADAEKQEESLEKSESENSNPVTGEQTDEKSEQPSEDVGDDTTGDEGGEDTDTETQEPTENVPDTEKQDEGSDTAEDEPTLDSQAQQGPPPVLLCLMHRHSIYNCLTKMERLRKQ